jgi:chaperonin cofactor prefoldin
MSKEQFDRIETTLHQLQDRLRRLEIQLQAIERNTRDAHFRLARLEIANAVEDLVRSGGYRRRTAEELLTGT